MKETLLHHGREAYASCSDFRPLTCSFWMLSCDLEGHIWSSFPDLEVAKKSPVAKSNRLQTDQKVAKFSEKIAKMATVITACKL